MRFSSPAFAVLFASLAFGQDSSLPSSAIPSATFSMMPSDAIPPPTGTFSVPTSVATNPIGLLDAVNKCCPNYLTIAGLCAKYFIDNPSKYPTDNVVNESIVLIKCVCAQPDFLTSMQACSTCLAKDPSVPPMAGDNFNSTTYTAACADPENYIKSNPSFQAIQGSPSAGNSTIPLEALSVIAQLYAPTGTLANPGFLSPSATPTGASSAGGSPAGTSPAGASPTGASPSGTGGPSPSAKASSASALGGSAQVGWVSSMVGVVTILTVMMMMVM